MLPGDLVVRIPGLHCHDLWFNPWLGNWGPAIWDHRALCRQKIQEGKFHIFPIFRERATNSSSCTEYSPRPDPALHALYGSCHLIATFSGGGNWVAASESPGTRLWTQDFSFQSSCPLSPHSRDKKELLNEWLWEMKVDICWLSGGTLGPFGLIWVNLALQVFLVSVTLVQHLASWPFGLLLSFLASSICKR